MSKSRIMKLDSAGSKEIDAYTLKNVTAVRSSTTFSYGETIGGGGAETEREAYLRGFSSGEQAGKEQGLKEIEAQFHFLAEMIEKFKSVEQELVTSAEHDVLQLSLAIAKKILRQEIQQEPEKIQEFIREAMEKMNQSEKFLIRLHPVDKATLAQTGAPIFQKIDQLKSIHIEADPNLQPGECLIETHARMVDGRFDSQLGLFGEAFFDSKNKR